MKVFSTISALLTIPALVASAVQAAELGALKGIFPTDGSMRRGVAVRPVFPNEITQHQQKIAEAVNAFSDEDKKAFQAQFDPTQLPAYDKRIWPDKAEYDKFVEVWKKVQIQAFAEVAIGVQEFDNNQWGIISMTRSTQTGQTVPLVVGSLTYDANKNVWLSANGELAPKEVQHDAENVYGARTGTLWSLSKEDALSSLKESLRITTSADGKTTFIQYNFSEVSKISGAQLAHGEMTCMLVKPQPRANTGTRGRR